MTATDRKTDTEQLFKECFEVMHSKGVDYASKEDSLANFKRNAAALGLTKYQILLIYLNKHLDSINNAIKYHPELPRTETVSEPLRGRVIDAINYLTILINMLTEDDRESDQQEYASATYGHEVPII
jgi:hypothetical protein